MKWVVVNKVPKSILWKSTKSIDIDTLLLKYIEYLEEKNDINDVKKEIDNDDWFRVDFKKYL